MSNASGISHTFDTGYAMAYGVNEAIMIRNLQFFITANANRGQNFHEGRHWTYDKLADFPKHFPYWSVDQVKRIIKSLVTQGVIIIGHFNKHWSDRTCWYAFQDEAKFIVTHLPKKQPSQDSLADLAKSPNDIVRNRQMTNGEIANCSYSTSTITSTISSSPYNPSSAGAESSASADGVSVSKKSCSSDKKKPQEFSPEAQAIASRLIEVMQRHSKTFRPPDKPVFQKVAAALLQQKQDVDYILKILDWACRDTEQKGDWDGWSAMIYSVPTRAKEKYGIEKFLIKLDSIEKKMKAAPKCKLAPGADLSLSDESTAANRARAL